MVDSPVRRKCATGRMGGGARCAEVGVKSKAPPLPPGYALDASDPDLLFLLRAAGTTAARAARHTAARAGRGPASARNGRRP